MCMLCLDTSLKAIHNGLARRSSWMVMCMLCLDTSLKAIHNQRPVVVIHCRNVYAMLRYKFESNSQPRDPLRHLAANVYAMIRYKFESNSQLAGEAQTLQP